MIEGYIMKSSPSPLQRMFCVACSEPRSGVRKSGVIELGKLKVI